MAADLRAPIETDVVIVGAGPVALFAVFQLGLLEIRAEVIDALPHAGGQCLELYADKPIYDIPGLPFCTGRELVDRLERQIAPFSAGLHLQALVSDVAVRDDGRFDVATEAGARFVAKAVIVAGGVGAFQPRRLKVAGLEPWFGGQVLHRDPGAAVARGHDVIVAGNGEAALVAALEAASGGASTVTLLHRRDDFDAPAAVLERFAAARADGRVAFVAGQPVAHRHDGDRLTGLAVECADGSDRTLDLDLLLVLQGWSPRLGPIAEWGLRLERKQVVVDPARFETSTPGIHAIGDLVTYPGKQKLIVCGFHEATLAAWAIVERVHPDRAQPLLYTTTSPKLHRLLGVAGDGESGAATPG